LRKAGDAAASRLARPQTVHLKWYPQENPVSENDPAIAAMDRFIADQGIDKGRSDWKTTLNQPPTLEFDAGAHYFWNISTNVGDMKIKLMPEIAPMHVSSTIYLARLGFYDDVIFHRVIDGFMAQGGDPLGRGTGGPGYEYNGEFSPSARHDRPNLLSMANAGPGTDGSQFFLTFVPTPHLDDNHSIFGEIVEGTETMGELEKRGSRGGNTTERLLMNSTTITVE
jgi:cyclophilin family peptidyl-prolyl cis-trans isomerase